MTSPRIFPHSADDSATSTPRAADEINLLGPGIRHEGVALTRDEWRSLDALYGETDRSGHPIVAAGNDRDLLRLVSTDGLRIVAGLARHVPPGADPLATVVQAVAAAGWDVDPADLAWAHGEDGEEGDDGRDG